MDSNFDCLARKDRSLDPNPQRTVRKIARAYPRRSIYSGIKKKQKKGDRGATARIDIETLDEGALYVSRGEGGGGWIGWLMDWKLAECFENAVLTDPGKRQQVPTRARALSTYTSYYCDRVSSRCLLESRWVSLSSLRAPVRVVKEYLRDFRGNKKGTEWKNKKWERGEKIEARRGGTRVGKREPGKRTGGCGEESRSEGEGRKKQKENRAGSGVCVACVFNVSLCVLRESPCVCVPRGAHPADRPRRFRRGHRKQSAQWVLDRSYLLYLHGTVHYITRMNGRDRG